MHKIYLLLIVFVLGSCMNASFKAPEENPITPFENNDYINLQDSISNEAIDLKEQGIQLFDKGDFSEAIDYYNKAIEIIPYYAVAYNKRGISKRNLGDFSGAMEDYTKAIEFDPQYADAYYNRGILKRKYGDLEGAIKDYTKAIYIDSEHAAAYNNRGICKNNLRDLKGAIEDYTKAIEIDSQYSQAYYNRANAKRSLCDNEGALLDYTKAIEINPYYGNAYINRGVLKYQMGDYEGEIEDYRICLSMAKETDNVSLIEEVSNNLGRALYDLKRFEESAEAYSEGILVAPDNGRLYYGRGLARNQSGDRMGACNDWRKSSMLGVFQANTLLPLCEECELELTSGIDSTGHR